MAGPVGWPVSVHSISDWVTPFLTDLDDAVSGWQLSLSSLDRECRCSAVSSSSTGSYPKRIS